jgi:LysM repeat protein
MTGVYPTLKDCEEKMSNKDSAQNVIESYRKRQSLAQKAPLIFGISALLLIIGAGAIIFWLAGPDTSPISMFSTDTPTPTETSTSTPTSTATSTPTETPTSIPTDTPTVTPTPTASGPFIYTVSEGDSLSLISARFEVDLLTILALNPGLNPNTIFIGQQILIPSPDTQLPTSTPVPATCRGIQEYTVKQGDSVGDIAIRFYTTINAIVNENKLESPNAIEAGDVLKIPCGLATPVPTWTPGSAGSTPGTIMTLTPIPSDTAQP